MEAVDDEECDEEEDEELVEEASEERDIGLRRLIWSATE